MESSTNSDFEFLKKLILLVKDKPFLYNKDLEDFKDEAKKNEAWNTIAYSLNLGVEDTQMRWARLRVDYGRNRRKKQAAEACGAQVREWPLFNHLTWLAPHVKTRAKRTKRKRVAIVNQETPGYKPILPRPNWSMHSNRGVEVEVSPSILLSGDTENISESLIVSPDTAEYDDEASLEEAHQTIVDKDFDHGKEHSYSSSGHVADSRSGHTAPYEDEDEDSLFCRSICASLKRFPNQQKALAKIRIQQVMYEVEFNQSGRISHL